MVIHTLTYAALALAISGGIVPSAPSAERTRPGTGSHPILSDHAPSPFKMPKAGGAPHLPFDMSR